MKDKKMKGGIFEWPFLVAALIFALIIVLGLVIGAYLRSATVGPPAQITTYTEYRWMNYFPSASLFYLTYPVENWIALNEIAKTDFEETMFWNRGAFVNFFSGKGIDLDKFDGMMKELEKKTNKEGLSFVIKDRKGLIISLGLPEKHFNASKWASFPEAYPYSCQYKEMPIFSKETDNMRLKFIFCCQKIIDCGDYIATAGRDECSYDPCGVGPGASSCKFYFCKGDMDDQEICLDKKKGTRVCIEDEPPKIEFTARFKGDSGWSEKISMDFEKEDVEVEFKLDVYDLDIKQIIIKYGVPEERAKPLELDELNKETLEKGGAEVGTRYYFSHTYELPMEYTAVVEVVDKSENKNKGEVEIWLKD